MLNRLGRLFAAAAIGVFLNVVPALAAQETGFSGLHAQMRVGGRLCHASHVHHGAGSGATRKAALREAVASWQSFTAWEYGDAWKRFSKAIAKTRDCSRRGARYWRCNVKARACQTKVVRHANRARVRARARANRVSRKLVRRTRQHRTRRYHR